MSHALTRSARAFTSIAAVAIALCTAGAPAVAHVRAGVPLPPVRYVVRNGAGLGPTVQPKVQGEILGFDIDQHGDDGLFANYRDLSGGKTEYSVETFDQRTGEITKVVAKGKIRTDNYAVYAILAGDVGFLSATGGFTLMNPVTGDQFNGSWTPPTTFYVGQIAENQATPTQVMFGYDGGQPSQPTVLVVADVVANTSSIIALDQSTFGTGDVPAIAQDSRTNEAVIAGGNGARNSHSEIGIVDLATGKTATFQGLGYGLVNGLAVDSKTGIACATTEIDAGVEFYDIRKRTGFEVQLPNSGGEQIHSGSGVAMDPVNHLCLIAQPVSGNGTQASAIWVADEKGDFLEEIAGFNFWYGVGPAINPRKRIGYVLNPRPSYETLTGFTY